VRCWAVLFYFILSERLLVSGSGESVTASVGEGVTLSCSVDSHIKPEHIEVSWLRTDGDILVLLFQKNETLPDSSDEQYRDRVEFFTAEIPKGNFSLRLKSVRTEDKGVYMCLVFAGDLSANATVVLEQFGESKNIAKNKEVSILSANSQPFPFSVYLKDAILYLFILLQKASTLFVHLV
uniref:Ig-like domain-containing protein n=1 Tax=Sinocyclocheilus rhinocerous TaxID=307959 RepID=A0A673NP98_9TELE